MNSLGSTRSLRVTNDGDAENGQVGLETKASYVLVVEDDPFSQKLFSNIIKKVYENDIVVFADNCEQAREKILELKKLRFAIVDVFLQGSRLGIELLNLSDRVWLNIPIVVTSSLSPERLHDMIRVQGHKYIYLKKPFQPEACRTILEKLKFVEN